MAGVEGLAFNSSEVRQGIITAMMVGLPTDEEDWPTFVFSGGREATSVTDSDGVPLDWQGDTEVRQDIKVRVPCAVEYLDDKGRATGFGNVSPSQVLLTLLDEEYAQIEGFSHVLIGGTAYRYMRTVPPLGLVSVGVYQVYCRTDDEG